VIVDGLYKDDRIDFTVETNDVRLVIKAVILEELRLDDEVDRVVRQSIASYSRRIPEGSKEWEVVYNKIYAEEMKKRRNIDL
jgi:hypothetical protein